MKLDHMPRVIALANAANVPGIQRGDHIYVDISQKTVDRDGWYMFSGLRFIHFQKVKGGFRAIGGEKRSRTEHIPTRKLKLLTPEGRAVMIGRFL